MPIRREAIDEILADKGWLTVDQMAAEVASRGLVDETYQRAAVHRLLKVDLRKILRSARRKVLNLDAGIQEEEAEVFELTVHGKAYECGLDDQNAVILFKDGAK